MIHLSRFKIPSVALGMGVVSAIGFAPVNWWGITLITVATLMWLAVRAERMRSAAALGWFFGVGHFAVGLNWIATAFTFQNSMPHWLGWIAVFALALYLAVFPALAVALAWWLALLPRWMQRRRTDAAERAKREKLAKIVSVDMLTAREQLAIAPEPYAFILTFAGSWIAAEYLRSIAFTGFAWNPLGAIMIDAGSAEPAFMGLTRLIGTYGLSGLMILLAGIWFMALLPGSKRDRWMRVGWALLVAMLCQILSAYLLRPLPPRADPRITVVQPNINQNEKWDPKLQQANFVRLAELSGKPGPKPRLLMWPEAATAGLSGNRALCACSNRHVAWPWRHRSARWRCA